MSAVATKSKKSSVITNYGDIISRITNDDGSLVPLAKRRELAIGRDGAKVKPRGYHMDEAAVQSLKDQFAETKDVTVIANAYNRGAYHYLVLALATLGLDEQHPKTRVYKKMQTLMSDESTLNGEGKDATTAWERFANKEPRGDKGLDLDGRLDQNVVVMQRLTGLTPYAWKLRQAVQEVLGKTGGVIDVLVNADTGTEYLRLNTKSETPINQTKTRGMGSPAALAAEKAAAKVAKAGAKKVSKPKTKASKPKVKVETPAEPVTETAKEESTEPVTV